MFQEITVALGRGEPIALLTVVKIWGAAPCAPGARLLVHSDGRVSGTLGGAATDARAVEDALRSLNSGQPFLTTYHLDAEGGESVGSCGASLEVFVEPLRPESRLLVAGSGYVAQALARLAVPLGWRVTLLDDRSEFIRGANLPENVETGVGDLVELLVKQHPNPGTAIVVVTRGHRSDGDALRAALATSAGYVGMIGSIGKVRTIFRALLKEGASPETLERVHAPIGLDLGAKTPDEIALSIAAELQMWRRGGSGGSLRDQAGIVAELLLEQAASGMEDVEDAIGGERDSSTEDVATGTSADGSLIPSRSFPVS
ncbi:MAG: XdhC family protein [Ktedonobacterales bacterium]